MSSFETFATERGLIIDHLASGRWVRVPTVDHPHKRNGAYFFGGDYAHCQNWATMENAETWFDGKPRTPLEQQDMNKRMAASKASHAKERAEGQRKAAEKAKWILSQCVLDKHAYMDGKGFADVSVNVWRRTDSDPVMCIPMFYDTGIAGLQIIDIQGGKKFLKGQRTNDCYFKIGQSGAEYLCEGYASALSLKAILAALRMPATIYATFSASNLGRMAKHHPSGYIVADNDVSGTGQKVASESGLPWWMPETVGHDVNDFHREHGLFKASQIFRKQY
jgi:putative DNA primase/helicase